MAYQDLLELEGVNSQFLVVLTPRRKVTSWTLVSGAIYQSSFDYGTVLEVTEDGVSLTANTSSALSSGQFYYDKDTKILYVRTSGDVNPTTKYMVASFELYAGTFDAHFPRIPTDTETTSNFTVYFDPIVEKTPVLKQTNNDLFFGFLPSQTSEIVLTNAEHPFERIIFDSSFNKGAVKVYHWLGDLEKDNTKLVYSGVMGNVTYTTNRVRIATFESLERFEAEFRHSGDSFFATSSFPNLDSKFQARPIRGVYGGPIDGFIPVNVSYLAENPTTSDNRTWVVCKGQTGLGDITRTVPVSPSSTTTRTYLDDATGFTIGDGVWLNKATDEYRLVTAVDYSSNYIEHEALSSGAATTGNTVVRGFVSKVTITKSGINYTAFYNRDYSLSTALAQTTSGFVFNSSLETNTGMPATLSPSDRVTCRVYGPTNSVTLGGNPFGTDDTKTANLRDAIVILFDILKKSGVAENEINTTSFTSSTNLHSVGLAIPDASNKDFPKLKDLIIKILQTCLLRFYIDNNRKIKISPVDNFTGNATKEAKEDEIIDQSFNYNFNYSDILSTVNVDYHFQEVGPDAQSSSNQLLRVTSSSNDAKYLHSIQKSNTFNSLHTSVDLTEAQALADKLKFIYGDRSGDVSFQVKNKFFDILIGDTIDVIRTKMPEFEYDSEIERTQRIVVTSVERSLRSVNIQGNDQKGVEDNSGSF